MNTYIITITEESNVANEARVNPVEIIQHYRRRVELPDVNTVISRLDEVLNTKVRATRKDKGVARSA